MLSEFKHARRYIRNSQLSRASGRPPSTFCKALTYCELSHVGQITIYLPDLQQIVRIISGVGRMYVQITQFLQIVT